jgi:hypothetical protein
MVFADSICCCLLDGDVVTMVVAAVVVSYAAVESHSMYAAFLLCLVVAQYISTVQYRQCVQSNRTVTMMDVGWWNKEKRE